MCNPRRVNSFCSKLSDYDDLCTRVSERHRLKGFYRAFMSTSTQWLSNLFAGICVNAKVVNMHVKFLPKIILRPEKKSSLSLSLQGTNAIRCSRRYVLTKTSAR